MTREQKILANLVYRIEHPRHGPYAGLDNAFANTWVHFNLDGVEHHHPILDMLSVLSGKLDYFAVEYFNNENDEFVEVWITRADYLDILEQDNFVLQSH